MLSEKLLVTAFWVGLVAVVASLIWIINTKAPCWLFTVQQAPVRCITEAMQ